MVQHHNQSRLHSLLDYKLQRKEGKTLKILVMICINTQNTLSH